MSHEKTNIMDSALCIDPDQPAQSTQDNPGRHIPLRGRLRYRVLILETENPQADTLYSVQTVGFLVGLLLKIKIDLSHHSSSSLAKATSYISYT